MKKQLLLITLLCYTTTFLQAALEPKNARIDITERHLTRIAMSRGLILSLFNEESHLKSNAIKNVTMATKELFKELIKEGDLQKINVLLRRGADSRARMTFEHNGTLFSVTPYDLLSLSHYNLDFYAIHDAFTKATTAINLGIAQQRLPRAKALKRKVRIILKRCTHPDSDENPEDFIRQDKSLTIQNITAQELEILLRCKKLIYEK